MNQESLPTAWELNLKYDKETFDQTLKIACRRNDEVKKKNFHFGSFKFLIESLIAFYGNSLLKYL